MKSQTCGCAPNDRPVVRSNWETVVWLSEQYQLEPGREWRLQLVSALSGVPYYRALTREGVKEDAEWDGLSRFGPEDVRLYMAIYQAGVRQTAALDNMPLAGGQPGEPPLPLLRLLTLLQQYLTQMLAVVQAGLDATDRVLPLTGPYRDACLAEPPGAPGDLRLFGRYVAALGQVYCGLATSPPLPTLLNVVNDALRDLEGHVALLTQPPEPPTP